MARHLAIGDIHGCFAAFDSLLRYVKPRDDDVLVTLGDYCDRGPDTRAVIELLLELDSRGVLRPIRGNHDIMMLNARKQDLPDWLDVGGKETLASYATDGQPGDLSAVPDSHWRFLETKLLPYFETDSHIFVHANLYPDIPLAEQPEFMLYWEKFSGQPRHESGKMMVCGHTSQKSGLPLATEHAVCIDTRVFGSTGWLTCLDADSGKLWQANNDGETRQMWLDEL